MRIAIVEDRKEWQERIKSAFEKEDHTVIGVYSNTSEATFKAILKNKPDVLMMDIELEEQIAGIKLVQKLNKEKEFRKVMVVFLTSLEDERFFVDAHKTVLEKQNKENNIADYVEKRNFSEDRKRRTVREIITKIELKKPTSIHVHGRTIFLQDILWVTIDTDYQKEKNQKRLAIIVKNQNNEKEVIYAFGADLKDFSDPENQSLYAKEKLIPINRDTLVNLDNAPLFTHPEGRTYFVHFSLDKNDLSSRLQASQRIGAELYKKYVR